MIIFENPACEALRAQIPEAWGLESGFLFSETLAAVGDETFLAQIRERAMTQITGDQTTGDLVCLAQLLRGYPDSSTHPDLLIEAA
jgi:hypothetical protein